MGKKKIEYIAQVDERYSLCSAYNIRTRDVYTRKICAQLKGREKRKKTSEKKVKIKEERKFIDLTEACWGSAESSFLCLLF